MQILIKEIPIPKYLQKHYAINIISEIYRN